ncbi:MAG TPA: hypothetical protein VD926_10360, partial [Acidimicrobiales bacterium]|nr:hypothetical protein [Acidimicrobiales bacterium]
MTTRPLPQLDAEVFLADGGIETTLIFDDGLELPDFAAFTLLDDADGRAALVRYFERYAEVAVRPGDVLHIGQTSVRLLREGELEGPGQTAVAPP